MLSITYLIIILNMISINIYDISLYTPTSVLKNKFISKSLNW